MRRLASFAAALALLAAPIMVSAQAYSPGKSVADQNPSPMKLQCWDGISAYIPCTFGGSGSGDASAANQIITNTRLGDVTAPATGSINYRLNQIYGALSGIALDSSITTLSAKFGTLGQKAMAGSAPVVIASDQSAVPASQSGTWTFTLTSLSTLATGAKQDSLLAALGSTSDVAWSSGTGTALAYLRTAATAALDTTTPSPVQGTAAHGAAVSGPPVRIGARVRTSNVSTLANDQTADVTSTVTGALITHANSIPELEWNYAAAASGISNTTTAVTLKASAAAGIRNYITGCDITSTALTAGGEYVIRDGASGTVIWRTYIGTAGLPMTKILFSTPLRGTAATLTEFAALTASTTGSVYINCGGYQAP